VSLWGKVGITPMIGQNDVLGEKFTLDDAAAVNQFAVANHVGLMSMWSMNRDANCVLPVPVTSNIVRDNCSGVDQGGLTFHEALSAGATDLPLVIPTWTSSSPAPSETPTLNTPDDPATSPFPVWDATSQFPDGTRITWRHNVYTARWWTTGIAPDSPQVVAADNPWRLIGPVMPGDHPAPLPTLPAGTYPTWDQTASYNQGARVQVGLVPYEAKWWTTGELPGHATGDASPWRIVFPTVTDLG
jgi:chitinase